MYSKIFNDLNALKLVADSLPVAVFIKDAASKILFVNKVCEAHWGMHFSDLYGTDGSQLFPSDQMKSFLDKDKEVFTGKCQVDFEETYWNVSFKQNRIGHTFKNPIYDDSGQPLYLICTTIDITEKKQAENYENFRSNVLEQLNEDKPLLTILDCIVREVEQHYPAMLCSIMLLDKSGSHFGIGIAPSLPGFYNRALEGMSIGVGEGSCGTAAVTGKRVIVDDIATHPYWLSYKELAYSAGLAACWSQPIFSSSGQILGTFAIYHREKRIPTELSIAVIEQSAYLVSIIIERKQAEEDRRIAATAFETQEGMMIVDSHGVILRVNHSFTNITGYTAKESVGQTIHTLSFGYHNAVFYAEIWQKVKRSGVWQGEVMNRRKNGDLYSEYLTIATVKDCNEEITHYVATVNDITEYKCREQQAKEHLNELAHVTRLGLMGEMASGIAHEVNQPLCAISSYTQVSLNLIKTKNPDLVKLTDIAIKTQEQALRAGKIIHRMKSFCKYKEHQHSSVDINMLINDSVSLCADGLKQNNITLTFELEDNLPLINIDHIQIEQVVINLICNSIDALLSLSEKSYLQITIQSQLTSDNKILVRVKDNGIGINEHQQQKILTPFYTTKTDGMGMGLSISRSLIEAHGGFLSFNSQLGNGATFYFTLPITKEKADVE